MAAPMKTIFTYCKLSTCYKVIGGIGSVKHYKSYNNPNKDRTASQQHRNDPARIEETPGPWKNYTHFDAWKQRPRSKDKFDPEKVTKMLEEMSLKTDTDLPVNMPDPFQDPPKRCILCQHNIELSYKNPQLLSQFVSPYTGRLYGRHITGLCLHMQQKVAREVRTARRFGFMPTSYKSPKFLTDPQLFNPFQRKSYIPGQ